MPETYPGVKQEQVRQQQNDFNKANAYDRPGLQIETPSFNDDTNRVGGLCDG
jgi:hypothetical protein